MHHAEVNHNYADSLKNKATKENINKSFDKDVA